MDGSVQLITRLDSHFAHVIVHLLVEVRHKLREGRELEFAFGRRPAELWDHELFVSGLDFRLQDFLYFFDALFAELSDVFLALCDAFVQVSDVDGSLSHFPLVVLDLFDRLFEDDMVFVVFSLFILDVVLCVFDGRLELSEPLLCILLNGLGRLLNGCLLRGGVPVDESIKQQNFLVELGALRLIEFGPLDQSFEA